MISSTRPVAALFALFALAPLSAAVAQPAAGNLAELRPRIQAGDKVFVTDDSGAKIKGSVLGVSAVSLTLLRADGARLELGEDRLRRIEKRGFDPVWQGAVIGAAIGMSPILFYCRGATESGEKCSDQGSSIAAFAALGAGIGAAVDALIPGKKRIYQSRGRAPLTVALSPAFSRGAKGVRVGLQF